MRIYRWLLLLTELAIAQDKLPPEIVIDRLRNVLEIDPVHYKKDLENDHGMPG